MGQTQNKFEKIRNEHADEVLEYEGAFDSDEVAITLATSIIPSSELVKNPHDTRIHGSNGQETRSWPRSDDVYLQRP